MLPAVTTVADNGGPFRSFRFEAFISAHPELRHVRTQVRSPGQNGSRDRGFGLLKYERSPKRSTTFWPSSNTPRPSPGTVPRRPPWRRRPDNPQLSRDRKPANYLTRGQHAGVPSMRQFFVRRRDW